MSMLLISAEHVHSANILSVTCPKKIKMPHLCLDLMGKEACMLRPECAAVEIDWQLLSPVTPCFIETRHRNEVSYWTVYNTFNLLIFSF